MKADEFKKISERMDREISKRFNEYRKFDEYVRQEVRNATSQMYLKCGLVGLVLAVLGLFGIPIYVQNKAKEYLDEATSREGLVVLSNKVVSVVQERVPAMINLEWEKSSCQLRGIIEEQMSNSIQQAECRMATGLAGVELMVRKTEQNVQALDPKLRFLDVVISAKAGNRKCYDELRTMMSSSNTLATLARDAVTEINGRYQQRRYAFDTYHPMLQRPDFKLEKESLVEIVHCDFDWNCDGAINELVALRDKGFVETLVYAVANSKRLDTVYTAIKGLGELTGQKFSPLGVDDVSGWWKIASTNRVYHSGYEEFAGFLAKVREEKGKITTQNKIDRLSLLAGILDEHPNLLSGWRYVVYLASDLPDDVRFGGQRRTLYEKAIERIDALCSDKVEADLIRVVYYLIGGRSCDEAYAHVNESIARYSDYENRARASRLFNESFFNNPAIDWTGGLSASVVAKNNKTAGRRQSGMMGSPQSENCVGYMSVTIRKGRRALLELPFGKSAMQSSDTLGVLSGCDKGDVISWTIAGRSWSYQYDGAHWIDANGSLSDAVGIPVGEAVIYYERKSELVSSISFSGDVSEALRR